MKTASQMRQVGILRIVVASPSDVQDERDILTNVVNELNRVIARERGLRLEVYRWETDTYPGFHPEGPQGLIDRSLHIADCDALICIFWKRFGSPVKDARSGTEHEFQQAYDAWKKTGGRRPRIMLYFNETPATPKSKEEADQWGRVLEFRSALPPEAFWKSYIGVVEFERLVRDHLTRFISEQKPFISETTAESRRRPPDELLQAYRGYLTKKVSTVRIFGEAELQPLEKVFIELNLTGEYKRPTVNTAWLGMMDAELRRRRNVFAGVFEEYEESHSGGEAKRMVKPDELRRVRTRAVITGAPGCGKTTLIKYLALKTLSEDERFPVLLELKSISKLEFEAAKGRLDKLLFEKVVAGLLQLNATEERDQFEKYFIELLGEGSVSIFLDGLDEVRGEVFFSALCNAVNEFVHSAYGSNNIIITTRPYALEAQFQGMLKMEIAPLNNRQIQSFLEHYYADSQLVRDLPQHLRRRRELSELAHVPFLLGVIAELYQEQGQVIGARLQLYRQIVNRLIVRLDKEKAVARFRIEDPQGLMKREFLKQLAYERLFVDSADKNIERFVFTSDEILGKALRFCARKMPLATKLVADVIATPLLREVATDTYAFAHLTIQEFLAAEALAEQDDYEKIFCRKIFDPALVALEVLPMALGLVRDPGPLYEAMEQLPESLDFTNLRLRARGLTYARKIGEQHLSKLTDRLLHFLSQPADRMLVARPAQDDEGSHLDHLLRSFAVAASHFVEFILNRIEPLLSDKNYYLRQRAAWALGEIGDMRSVNWLLPALHDSSFDVRWAAAEALGKIGDDRAVDALLVTLKSRDSDVSRVAAEALGRIGDARAVDGLLAALLDEYFALRITAALALKNVAGAVAFERLLNGLSHHAIGWRWAAAQALGKFADARAVEPLLVTLKDEHHGVRQAAAAALGDIGDANAVNDLLEALKDEHFQVRYAAAEALGKIGDTRAVEGLLVALSDDNLYVRQATARALGTLHDARAMDGLMDALLDEYYEVRQAAAEALANVGDVRAVDELLFSLWDNDLETRRAAARALGRISGERVVEGLLIALSDANYELRMAATEGLAVIRDVSVVEHLLPVLKDKNIYVRRSATWALEQVGDARALDGLLEALNDEAFKARELALKDGDFNVPTYAVQALGKIGDARAVESLLATLQDERTHLRRKTVDALLKIPREEMADGLERALSNRDAFVRQKAAEAIGYYATRIEVLEKLSQLNDTDPVAEVRKTASEAQHKFEYKLQYFL